MLNKLKETIPSNAFDNVRGQMGIHNLSDLEQLVKISKPYNDINYNKFDCFMTEDF